MIETGTIVNVEVETLGAEIAEDVSPGDSVLTLRNVVDFTDLGGSLTIGGETHTFSPNAVDDDALTVTIDDTLVSGFSEGEFVYVAPAPIVRYWAHVQIEGDDDEVVLAELSRPLAAMVIRGARAPEDQETSAVLEDRDGTWTVVDILGLEPGIIGPSIDVPEPGVDGFHVAKDGTWTVGMVPTPGETPAFVRVSSDGLWGKLEMAVDQVDNPGYVAANGAGFAGSRIQSLSLAGPHDDDLPTASVSLVSQDAGMVPRSTVQVDADTLFVQADLIATADLYLGDDLKLKETGTSELTLRDNIHDNGVSVVFGGDGSVTGDPAYLSRYDFIALPRRTSNPAAVSGYAIVYERQIGGAGPIELAVRFGNGTIKVLADNT